jgi:hypothetical protein
MAGRASNAAGHVAGRYNLRPGGVGDRIWGGVRGDFGAALSDSPLLGRLLVEWSDVFDFEVLPLLDPTTRALLGRCGQACRDAVLRSPKLPCSGRTVGVTVEVIEFVVSVPLLAWAKENGCPWKARVCALGCSVRTTGGAAVGAGAGLSVGHQDVPVRRSGWAPGRVVQADPINPSLKAPGTKRLKLKY